MFSLTFAQGFVSFVLNFQLAAVAVMRRENSSSAINNFVFACVLSSLLPAQHIEAASFLLGQHKGLSELEPPIWVVYRKYRV